MMICPITAKLALTKGPLVTWVDTAGRTATHGHPVVRSAFDDGSQ